MRWQEFIDGYDWKARVIPTAIILLPLFWTFYYFYPGVLGSPLHLAGSSLLSFALIYLASMFFRDLGVRYARQFWNKRGGMPSTRFGRMRDSFLSHDQKKRIQLAVLNRFGIRLMSIQEECERPRLQTGRSWTPFERSKSSCGDVMDAVSLISTVRSTALYAICAEPGWCSSFKP